jgi:hypothetical protein
VTALQLLQRADNDTLARLGVMGAAETPKLPYAGRFDNRPTWDNVGPGFDKRRTWDNWNNRSFDNQWTKKK